MVAPALLLAQSASTQMSAQLKNITIPPKADLVINRDSTVLTWYAGGKTCFFKYPDDGNQGARVTIGDEVKIMHENESVYVPIGSRHRLENPGKIDLELIEVQTGSYLDEDDIVRFEDDYHRS